MEILSYTYTGINNIKKPCHVGVVGSGNLEMLFEPTSEQKSKVKITTKFDGNSEIWKAILDRFFEEHKILANIEINDFGATPGVVNLRLLQALEVSSND